MLMSVGGGMLAALMVFGSLMALGPEDEVPPEWILIPAGLAALGIAMAAFGGAWSRWASGLMGTLYVTAGAGTLASERLQLWLSSRAHIATAVALCVITALGATAIVLAIRVARTSQAGLRSTE